MRKKTLILGMGNPILSDDGVGVKIVQDLAGRISDKDVDIEEASIGGFSIIDRIAGYKKVIIVDAIKTRDGQVGSIRKFTPTDFKATMHLSAPHTIDFGTAMALAEKYGYELPESILIYGIEIEDNTSFGEDCTPLVRDAVQRAADEILKNLGVSS
jgi:hydrogenase maturation protease